MDGVLGDRKLTAEDRITIVDYLKCVIFGVIMGWLNTGMDPTALTRFRRMLDLKNGDLEQLVICCMNN